MKNVSLIAFLVLLSSCFSMKDYVLDSDYSYRGRFNKYRTFNFMDDENTDASSSNNEVVQKAIKSRLSSMGYSQQDDKPDLLITYRFYYNDVSFLCYDQPEFNSWVKNNLGGVEFEKKKYDSASFYPVYNLEEESIEVDEDGNSYVVTSTGEYIPIKQEMLEGMIYLTFFDAKKNNTVWSGYMSGVFQDNKMENERFLRASVGKILDDYKVLARGFKYYN
ncbi:DUF4136 domain-containing protein [Marinoscillum sp. MHG1-6]|uniref:DUF4136 domain-containing protein n=1 Tax=Marinoscillum sp. MHG1-6 TaxID=2959627 RepID=UPI0021572B33|nr:DUF4136 domain-containing protein [Marinoscillum sp. MHG1-6]